MIKLPDEALLAKIKKKHLYLDEKSKELNTDRVKQKYKLAGNVILEQYFFNILTTSLSACKKSLTLRIKQKDWENKIRGLYLTEEISFCDITKFEWLEQDELIKKIKDRRNTFKYVAKLRDVKYQKLLNLQDKMTSYPYIPKAKKGIIGKGLSETIDDTISKLGLD